MPPSPSGNDRHRCDDGEHEAWNEVRTHHFESCREVLQPLEKKEEVPLRSGGSVWFGWVGRGSQIGAAGCPHDGEHRQHHGERGHSVTEDLLRPKHAVRSIFGIGRGHAVSAKEVDVADDHEDQEAR